MHRLLILLLLPAGACASRPDAAGGPGDIPALVRSLRDPGSENMKPQLRPEYQLASYGDDAVPALREALADPTDARFRGRAARALGIMWTRGGVPAALDAYIAGVKAAPSDLHARNLLAQAHHFRDPEGRVMAILDKALQEMRVVTPEMVAAAAVMTDVEAVETMMKVVARGIDTTDAPERDVALRYIGRAARRGYREAIPFLTMCTQNPNADAMEKASAELKLLAGRAPPKGWRAWWFDHVSSDRREWLAKSFDPVGGRPFDPTDRDHIGDLIARLPLDGEVEPEMWFLEQALARSFGYVSPRDVFDPEMDLALLAEANRRAVETARDWWRENSPYLFYNPASRRFDTSEEARRIGVPVDPRTGKPVSPSK